MWRYGGTQREREGGEICQSASVGIRLILHFVNSLSVVAAFGSAQLTDAALPKWEFDGCAQFDAASSLEFVDVVILAESILGSSFRRENVSARLSVFGSSKVPFCSSLSSVAFFLKVGKLEMLSGAIELDGQSDIGGSFSLSTSLL